jgi:hypothetical protein
VATDARPAATFKARPPSFRELKPKTVTGHLLRTSRAGGDRWVAHWRDSTGRQHKRVLGRVSPKGGRPLDGYLTRRRAQELRTRTPN